MIGTGATQPWNQVIFPSVDSNWPFLHMTATRLKAIPAIGRAFALIEGMAAQMPLDAVKGDRVLDRPRLLEQPDPDRDRAWWVSVQIEDYLTHGNAVSYVTTVDAAGWPATVAWVPAETVLVSKSPGDRERYWVAGVELDPDRVIHVRRGADPAAPWRGIGVVEQYLTGLARLEKQEAYEVQVLDGAAVPSVVVIAPNPDLSPDEAAAAKESWVGTFGGGKREPAILPAGTSVVPLAWSPADSQLVEARKMGLTDAANMMNIDGYWVGAEAGNYQYKSPGPMYLNLLRQTVGPILEPFELTWSQRWLPHGKKVRFDRKAVLADDMETTVRWAAAAVTAGLITKSEARVVLGYSADVPAELESVQPRVVPPAEQEVGA